MDKNRERNNFAKHFFELLNGNSRRGFKLGKLGGYKVEAALYLCTGQMSPGWDASKPKGEGGGGVG